MTSSRTYRGPRMVRFGEFELDVRAGELRRAGQVIRIQEQPLRLLAMLVEHPGEVVLREEIRKRLWPNDTVVEVGHGINAAVLRLREALGESAENPVYIETVARRGYRFRGSTGGPVPAADDLAGKCVGNYRILTKLGSGGMGVVYQAEDQKLGRHVALKLLPQELAAEPAAIGRFHREARAASALNHPNICTVYAVEEHDGQPVIVMEYLEGETLEAVLAAGPLPAAQAIAIAVQLAAALEAAHAKGIVHRDLKPGNIVLTSHGVKVLDFGLARMPRAAGGSHVTQEGAILGTPQYMSPEQEQGSPAGDIYSLGLVLREMLAAAPQPWQRIVARCLQKDPQARWQSAADLKAALEAIERPPVGRRIPSIRQALGKRRMRGVLIGAGCGLFALLLVAAWDGLRRDVPAAIQDVTRFSIATPGGGVVRLSLSPDGRRIAVAAANGIYVRAFDAVEPFPLYSGEGIGTPFWSPDGQSVAFAGGGKLRTVKVSGGPATVLCDVNTNVAGAWAKDGTILIGLVGDGLFRIPSAGGTLTRVTSLDAARGETRHMLPQFLPGGRRFIYLAGSDRPGANMLYAGSLDSPQRTPVMPMDSTAMFVPLRPASTEGYLVFARKSSLLAQAFDAGALRAFGQPISVADSVSTNNAVGASLGIAHFSVAGASLAYRQASSGPQGFITVVQNWMGGLRQ